MFQFSKKLLLITFKKNISTISTFTVKQTLLTKPIDQKIIVQGWVQAVRTHKDLYFVDLVDGTCLDRLQIVISSTKCERHPTYGSSIKIEGSVVKSSHKGQEIELVADSWQQFGSCSENYPFLNHQKYSPEYIRQFLHLRPRTKRFSSILRVRNHASMAVHNFFQENGFCFIHTPIITQNDCEGGGEVFSVEVKEKSTNSVSDDTNKQEQTKTISVSKDQSSSLVECKSQHFFNVPTFLTVSGQLHLEAMACALTHVYNFGPTFRAESSQSRLHASEFQMVEAEIAFTESIDDLLKIVEKCFKKVAESIMNNCGNEVNFLSQDIKGYEMYLNNLLSKPIVQMSYKECIDILQQSQGHLKCSIKFGDDLSTEHKQHLVKHCNNVPVFVCMFPASTKPFYMKTDEKDMAHCFDLFAAYGGEICGGSLREDSEERLNQKHQFNNSGLSWYLDLRKYGSVPHGGFGIGFERLLQSILGLSNIRDVIPFPRRKFDCKC